MQQLLEFIKTKEGNLRIQKVREKGVTQELRELWQDDSRGINSKFLEACEYELCNGWETIAPEDIGALTDGLLLADDCVRDDDYRVEAVGVVYWFKQYETVDPLEEILTYGFIEFEGNGEPIRNVTKEGLQDFLDTLPKDIECDVPMHLLRAGQFYVAHFLREDHSGFDVVYADSREDVG